MCALSFSTGEKLIDCTSVAHEVGEEHALCCSEAADSNESDPAAERIEVGDLVPFLATNKLGNGDPSV